MTVHKICFKKWIQGAIKLNSISYTEQVANMWLKKLSWTRFNNSRMGFSFWCYASREFSNRIFFWLVDLYLGMTIMVVMRLKFSITFFLSLYWLRPIIPQNVPIPPLQLIWLLLSKFLRILVDKFLGGVHY